MRRPRRIPFVLAVARGNVAPILRAIAGSRYSRGDVVDFLERGDHRLLIWTLDNSVTLPWASSGTNGKWTLLLCALDPLEWQAGTQFFRYLRRASLAAPADIRGPWSPRALHRLAPALAVASFGGAPGSPGWHLPLVIEGVSPGGDVNIDYDPPDVDSVADVEVDPDALFPEET